MPAPTSNSLLMTEYILHRLGTFLFQHLGFIDVHDVIILLLLPQDDTPQVFYILDSISPPGLNQFFTLPRIVTKDLLP